MELQSRDLGLDTQAGQQNFILTIFFLVFATVVVAARFASRRLRRTRPGIDDWLMVLGLVCMNPIRTKKALIDGFKFFYYCRGVVNLLSESLAHSIEDT